MTPNILIKNVLIGIFSAVLIFQFLLLTSVIPYEHTWGGRLASYQAMLVFVSVSIGLNGLFLYAVLVRGRYVRSPLPAKLISAVLWLMVVVFALNTIGNLFAVSPWERYLATPATLLLAILGYVIARENPSAGHS